MKERETFQPDLNLIAKRIVEQALYTDKLGNTKDFIAYLNFLNVNLIKPNGWVLTLSDLIFVLERVRQIEERAKEL